MPTSLKIYKDLTFLLLPFAYLFAFFNVIFLMSALVNPEILIFVFAIASFVFYIFTSRRFFKLGILNGQKFSNKSRMWLKVNTTVSLILCSLFLVNGLGILFTSDAQLMEFIETKAKLTPGLPKEFDLNMLLVFTKRVSAVILFTALLALPHIFLTFRFLKKYSYLFEEAL
jgi:hypothetical protein